MLNKLVVGGTSVADIYRPHSCKSEKSSQLWLCLQPIGQISTMPEPQCLIFDSDKIPLLQKQVLVFAYGNDQHAIRSFLGMLSAHTELFDYRRFATGSISRTIPSKQRAGAKLDAPNSIPFKSRKLPRNTIEINQNPFTQRDNVYLHLASKSTWSFCLRRYFRDYR